MKFASLRPVLLFYLLIIPWVDPASGQNSLNDTALFSRAPYYFGYLFDRSLVPVQGARVRYADYPAIRHKHPELQSWSEAQIDQLLLDNYAYVTKPQLEARGILFTHFEIDSTRPSRTAKVEQESERAANLSLLMPKSSAPAGIYNAKGFGRMNVGSGSWSIEFFVSLIKTLRTESVDFPAKSELQLLVMQMAEEVRASIRQLKYQMQDASLEPEQKRYYQLNLQKQEQNAELLIEIQEALSMEEPLSEKKIENLLNKIRSLDYLNGAITLDRALKEVVIQKALQKIFDQQAEALGRPVLGTIEIDFVIELPFQVLAPDGHSRGAAIIGRAPSVRMAHELRVPSFPSEIVGPGIGGFQIDGFGRLLDYELYEVNDKRLPSFFRWNEKNLTHPLDSEMLAVYSSLVDGDEEAFQKFLDQQLRFLEAPLPRIYSDLPEHYVDPDLERRVFEMIELPQPPSWQAAQALLSDLKQDEKNSVLMFVLAQHLAPIFPGRIKSFLTSLIRKRLEQKDAGLIFGVVQALARSGYPGEALELLDVIRMQSLPSPELFHFVDRIILSLAGCESPDGRLVGECAHQREVEGDLFSFRFLLERLANVQQTHRQQASMIENRIIRASTDTEKKLIVRISQNFIPDILSAGISFDDMPSVLKFSTSLMRKHWDVDESQCTDALKKLK